MTAQDECTAPDCQFCSTISEPVFLIPTFVFNNVDNGIVDGQPAAVINGMSPAWFCPQCGRFKSLVFEEADHWLVFWRDMIVELSKVMTKTQFLESAPFGKKPG